VLHNVTTITSYGRVTIRLSIDDFLYVLNKQNLTIVLWAQ